MVSAKALALFARGRQIATERGLILVDTKYEFGVDTNGAIILADEIHTPDSSRYWFAETYPDRFAAGAAPQSFDKDFVRSWVVARCDPYKDPLPTIPPVTAPRLTVPTVPRPSLPGPTVTLPTVTLPTLPGPQPTPPGTTVPVSTPTITIPPIIITIPGL